MSKFLERFDILPFFIILLFSLIFRVTNLNLIEFKTDEAVNLILASKFLPGGTVSSIGILNPPLFNYLLSPLTLITLDPKVFSFFIALINSLAIAFFYLIVRKYYGNIIAFTASVLFAFSPWAILYSRKIWTQDLLIPFFILMFYSFHKIVKDKKKHFWALFIFSSFFLIQLHQISIIFILLVFLFMLFKGHKPNLKYILIGTILGIIPLIPFLGYEVKNNYSDFKALTSSESRLSTKRSFQLFLRPLQIMGQGNFSFVLGPDLDTFVKKFHPVDILRRIFYFEYLMVVLGAFVYFKKFKQSRLLVYSAVILPFLYFSLKIEPFMHYYIIILPLLFLFLGIGFDFLFTKGRLIKSVSFLLFISIIVSSLAFNFSFFKLLSEQGYFRGDYGDSLKASQTHIKHKNYDELFLFQFVPLTYAFGYNPFAKMLYGNTSSEQIPIIEDKLQKSQDPRLEEELLSFYTKSPPDIKTLDILRRKFKDNLLYNNIYRETLNDFLAKNYKKEYVSGKFDLRFFYPSHWKTNEDNQIKIERDNLTLSIQKGEIPSSYEFTNEKTLIVLGEKAKKTECKKGNRLCGVTYYFKGYGAKVVQKGKDETGFKNEVGAVDDILNSMRFLSD